MTLEIALEAVREAIAGETDKAGAVARVRAVLHELSPTASMPIDLVRWVPLEQVVANDYNPNSVAPTEMRLLKASIDADGYTQPVVTFWDEEKSRYTIVDGFHRYTTMRVNPDVSARTGGLLPIVVIDKPLAERMASTVRHNRARGKHSVTGMSNMVFGMLKEGKTDEEICKELGMEAVELTRLKHVTGFATLFEGAEYGQAWITDEMARLAAAHKKAVAALPQPAAPAES